MVARGRGWRLFAWGGEGFADRLNSVYTVVVLLVAAVAVTVAPFVHSPIVCNTPAHYHQSAVDYANEQCWNSETYSPPSEIFARPEERKTLANNNRYLGLLLYAQALSFLLPWVFWRGLQALCGVCLDDVAHAADGASSSDPVLRDWSLRYLVKRVYHRSRGCNYTLVFSYFAIKAGYCLNVLFNLVFINYFAGGSGGIGFGFWIWIKALGRNVQVEITDDESSPGLESRNNTPVVHHPTFPNMIVCEHQVYRLGNIYRSVLECHLPLSGFFEMVFAGVWLWMLVVCVISFLSAFVWFWSAVLPPLRDSYVAERLVAAGKITEQQMIETRSFAQRLLSGDAYFLTRYISSFVSDATATAVISGLWEEYADGGTATTSPPTFRYAPDPTAPPPMALQDMSDQRADKQAMYPKPV